MIAIFTALLSMLSVIPGKLGDYFKTKQEIEQIKLNTEREIALAQLKAASEMSVAELELSKAALASTSPHFKYFTFFMWFGPFIVGIISPPTAKDIFTNLAGMPEWYVQSCMVIMFTVWGISVSGPAISNIFSGLGNFFEQRRDFKLEKAKIDKKAFFEALKAGIFKQGLSQSQVDVIDKALDDQENK